VSTKSAEELPNFTPNAPIRAWIAGFLLLGMLLGPLGSLVIVWHYHIDADPRLAGLHFLGLNAGYVLAAALAQRLLARISIRALAIAACACATASLLALSFLAPPAQPAWRIAGLAFLGAAAGLFMTALLHILQPYFARASAVMANLAGVLFGCGCLLATLMLSVTYFASSVRIQTALLALAPLLFGILYLVNKHPGARSIAPLSSEQTLVREALRDLRSVAAVLFSLLLFVQFGNEWAIAGWLPLYLIHRLGSNPAWAIFALAGYFLALMAGRLAVRALLPRISHPKLLMASTAAAMIGYLLLSFTTALPGAWIAVVVIAAGFAPVYPLIAETLDDRFSYHPVFYNGLFSIAITGAMCVPWLLGFVDAWFGVRYVMLIPAFGSIIVLVLALLIMLEARLMGRSEPDSAPPRTHTAAAGKS
jgi:MFS transporter, FHS family, glucose/mannose:H+ symporter